MITNINFHIIDNEFKFEDEYVQKWWDEFIPECDFYFFNETREEVESFLKEEIEEYRYFLYDPGSGESDYPESYRSFKSQIDIVKFVSKTDIYNIDNVIIFDFITGKTLIVKRYFSIIERDE